MNIGIEVIDLKKYLSVFMIYVRSSVLKFLMLMATMTAVQTVLYFVRPNKSLQSAISLGKYIGIEEILSGSGVFIVFGVTFVLLTAILCYAGSEFSGKQGYTLRRLRIKENKVFLMHMSANGMFYIMLLLWEIILIFAFMLLYLRDVPEEIYTNQMLMLSFYRNDFLGALLPMANIPCHVRNISWIITLAAVSAFFSYMQRRGKTALSLFFMTAIVLVGFCAERDGGTDILLAVASLLVTFSVLWRVMRGD